jgi:hypothetical protein
LAVSGLALNMAGGSVQAAGVTIMAGLNFGDDGRELCSGGTCLAAAGAGFHALEGGRVAVAEEFAEAVLGGMEVGEGDGGVRVGRVDVERLHW